ncbi:MAG: AIR synthase related protein [Candidatus Methanomethyliaceae archaeon]|nr:AIR synthase related protein [Candidatus Methanomethyliaceae archaeon]MDW7970838.1 AIR synthase related protein [Nitrososphaerota archaeon]
MESLDKIIRIAKEFKGFSRKIEIGNIVKIFGNIDYDDAGIIDIDDYHIVVSTDGITEDLVVVDPWFAGYYSVLVNVNDVIVKGAKPIGYVNVLSGPREIRDKIAKGIKEGLEKYGIRLLKGHTHPDTSYSAIDAAVIGIARKVVRGTTASPLQKILMVVDLDGSFIKKGWVKCFDSTINKSPREVQEMISAIISFIENGDVKCSKDVSAPGILGSLAMLCEASNVGAIVHLDKIPIPKDILITEWLTSYPAMGFIFGIIEDRGISILEEAGFSIGFIGEFTEDNRLRVEYKGLEYTFMDFSKESVIGLKSS